MYTFDSQKEIGASAALTSIADIMTFTPATAVEIVSFGVIVTTALNDGAGDGAVIGLDQRITAASDTGRVANAFGTLTLTTAQCQVAVSPAGQVLRSNPNPASTGEQAFVCFPGQQAVMKVTNAVGSAGNGLPFIEYKIRPYNPASRTSETLVTS